METKTLPDVRTIRQDTCGLVLKENAFAGNNLLSDTDFADFSKMVHAVDGIMTPTEVFDATKNKMEINPEIRRSVSKTIDDKRIIEYLKEKVIPEIASRINCSVSLADREVTLIQYVEGDFFYWHYDQSKVRLNSISIHWICMQFSAFMVLKVEVILRLSLLINSLQKPILPMDLWYLTRSSGIPRWK